MTVTKNFIWQSKNVHNALPTKSVYMGGRDPEFVTLLIKSLLNKRYNLRKKGNFIEANILVAKINVLISEVRKNHLRKLSDAKSNSYQPLLNLQKNTSPMTRYYKMKMLLIISLPKLLPTQTMIV